MANLIKNLTDDLLEQFALDVCSGRDNSEIAEYSGMKSRSINSFKAYAKGVKVDSKMTNTIYKTLSQRGRQAIDKVVDLGLCDLTYKYGKSRPCIMGPNKTKTERVSKKVTEPVKSSTTLPTKQLKLNFSPVKKEEKPVKATMAVSDVMTIVKQMYEVTMEALRKV